MNNLLFYSVFIPLLSTSNITIWAGMKLETHCFQVLFYWRGSAPAGAGYFYNAIKVAKSAARLASCGWHRSRQNLLLDNSAAISDTAPLERGRRNGKPFLSLRRLNLGVVTAETGVQILPPLTGARVGPQGELTACGRHPRALPPRGL